MRYTIDLEKEKKRENLISQEIKRLVELTILYDKNEQMEGLGFSRLESFLKGEIKELNEDINFEIYILNCINRLKDLGLTNQGILTYYEIARQEFLEKAKKKEKNNDTSNKISK